MNDQSNNVKKVAISCINEKARILSRQDPDGFLRQLRDYYDDCDELIRMVEFSGIPEKELSQSYLDLLKAKDGRNTNDHNELLSTAKQFVSEAYDQGKYDGRAMHSFLSKLLSMIDPKLGCQL